MSLETENDFRKMEEAIAAHRTRVAIQENMDRTIEKDIAEKREKLKYAELKEQITQERKIHLELCEAIGNLTVECDNLKAQLEEFAKVCPEPPAPQTNSYIIGQRVFIYESVIGTVVKANSSDMPNNFTNIWVYNPEENQPFYYPVRSIKPLPNGQL